MNTHDSEADGPGSFSWLDLAVVETSVGAIIADAAEREAVLVFAPLIDPFSGHPSMTLSPISAQFSLARTDGRPKRPPASAPS